MGERHRPIGPGDSPWLGRAWPRGRGIPIRVAGGVQPQDGWPGRGRRRRDRRAWPAPARTAGGSPCDHAAVRADLDGRARSDQWNRECGRRRPQVAGRRGCWGWRAGRCWFAAVSATAIERAMAERFDVGSVRTLRSGRTLRSDGAGGPCRPGRATSWCRATAGDHGSRDVDSAPAVGPSAARQPPSPRPRRSRRRRLPARPYPVQPPSAPGLRPDRP